MVETRRPTRRCWKIYGLHLLVRSPSGLRVNCDCKSITVLRFEKFWQRWYCATIFPFFFKITRNITPSSYRKELSIFLTCIAARIRCLEIEQGRNNINRRLSWFETEEPHAVDYVVWASREITRIIVYGYPMRIVLKYTTACCNKNRSKLNFQSMVFSKNRADHLALELPGRARPSVFKRLVEVKSKLAFSVKMNADCCNNSVKQKTRNERAL